MGFSTGRVAVALLAGLVVGSGTLDGRARGDILNIASGDAYDSLVVGTDPSCAYRGVNMAGGSVNTLCTLGTATLNLAGGEVQLLRTSAETTARLGSAYIYDIGIAGDADVYGQTVGGGISSTGAVRVLAGGILNTDTASIEGPLTVDAGGKLTAAFVNLYGCAVVSGVLSAGYSNFWGTGCITGAGAITGQFNVLGDLTARGMSFSDGGVVTQGTGRAGFYGNDLGTLDTYGRSEARLAGNRLDSIRTHDQSRLFLGADNLGQDFLSCYDSSVTHWLGGGLGYAMLHGDSTLIVHGTLLSVLYQDDYGFGFRVRMEDGSLYEAGVSLEDRASIRFVTSPEPSTLAMTFAFAGGAALLIRRGRLRGAAPTLRGA